MMVAAPVSPVLDSPVRRPIRNSICKVESSASWNQSCRHQKTTIDDGKRSEETNEKPLEKPELPLKKNDEPTRSSTAEKKSRRSSSMSKRGSNNPKLPPRKCISFDEQTDRRKPPRKTVSFGGQPTIVPIEHYKTIPKREISKRWWSDKDFAGMQHDTNNCLHLMEMGVEVADPNFTTRGLERLTESGMNKFLEERRDATIAVLEVQEVAKQKMFRNSRKTPDEIIAHAYRLETKRSQKKAAVQGQKDAKEVEDYLADCDEEKLLQEQKDAAANKQTKKNGDKPGLLGRIRSKSFSKQRPV